ncbi:MAG: hypothetical protein F6J86_09155 [Symploca sp. SIO1B1]|nr:hypothetical protein [Symploca sp. SIO1B1]
MTSYLISPAEETNLKIEREMFACQIYKQWHSAEVKLIDKPQSKNILEWRINLDKSILDGYLDVNGQVIQLYGSLNNSAYFAVWIRKQVSSEYKLFFYDEGYNADVELVQNITEREIIKAFV